MRKTNLEKRFDRKVQEEVQIFKASLWSVLSCQYACDLVISEKIDWKIASVSWTGVQGGFQARGCRKAQEFDSPSGANFSKNDRLTRLFL